MHETTYHRTGGPSVVHTPSTFIRPSPTAAADSSHHHYAAQHPAHLHHAASGAATLGGGRLQHLKSMSITPIPPELLTPVVWDENRLCRWCGCFCHVSHIEQCSKRMQACSVCREQYFVLSQPQYPSFPDIATHQAACEAAHVRVLMTQMERKRRDDALYDGASEVGPDDSASVRRTPRAGRPQRLARSRGNSPDSSDGKRDTSTPRRADDGRRSPPPPASASSSSQPNARRTVTIDDTPTSAPQQQQQPSAARNANAAGGGGRGSSPPTSEVSPRLSMGTAPPQPSQQAPHKECKWCGAIRAPDHEQECPQRLLQCKHCGTKIVRAEVKGHSKSCPAKRAKAATEL